MNHKCKHIKQEQFYVSQSVIFHLDMAIDCHGRCLFYELMHQKKKIESCCCYLRMLQENTRLRHLQSSQILVMFNYINRECHLYERQESVEVEKLKFLNFPIPAITEKAHDREARIRKDTKIPVRPQSAINQLGDTG